ncbi:hypothetical protein C1I97_01565 [Streptomyces sp. NTH33]|uniref:hypothetical protein n=1 Tax=Streptomyces sp. NTH33 TaxID=1735453 RepID=UPI000DA82AE1|nr:hypothetical protein [Streptomyces sp. NTH33]PZH20143.1 hypothetical protein C1I97_01565 [Streptomyces sp. NTH33]
MQNTVAPSVKPSAAQILDTPLPQLLDELHVDIFDSSIPDAEFFGAVVQRKNGELILSMPTERSELEHDTVARYLLAQVFDVDLPKLPAPFVTARADSGDSDADMDEALRRVRDGRSA